MAVAEVVAVANQLREAAGRVVMGHERTLQLLFTALLAEGHVLLEGVPGTAKTLLARTFAALLDLEFRRIQFTPDLMPADVVGTNLFDFQSSRFTLAKGPVFTELLLADELNRTPPKTQAALLEAMQERSVTLDGTTHALSPAFLVVATQNPIEQEGTYPLPEAQLDRFLLKLKVGYPARDQERAMVAVHGRSVAMPRPADFGLAPVVGREFLAGARQVVAQVALADAVADYVVDLVRATREHPSLSCGASPRAINMLAAAARALAALEGQLYVVPDHVKALAVPVLAHRLVLAPAAEIEGQSAAAIVEQIVEQTPAPR
ncbi:MAG: MoxR family ATPase [Planctomycetes bacterium]|nr:MoxR family ATPase [Planctomycetota bacterium]